MIDPAIDAFLNDRKEKWLKDKVKNKSEEEIYDLQNLANEDFSLPVWVKANAKRAKELYLSSHPAKFTHSGITKEITPIVFNKENNQRSDGFLTSNGFTYDADVYGNAAALGVYKFLMLQLQDQQNILSHLENNSSYIISQFQLDREHFLEVKEEMLKIKDGYSQENTTDERLKQIYFPVAKDYHLLSLLTNSGGIFKATQKIRDMHFSEEAKGARESKKKKGYKENGYSEMFNLSIIGYGGTKPQNISVLNNRYGGKVYLLPSTPPILKKEKIRAPKYDFFTNSLWMKYFLEDFTEFHKLLKQDRNNIDIRNRRDDCLRQIIWDVIDRLWNIRRLESGWSEAERYKNLPKYQRIWLDQAFADKREGNERVFDAIVYDFKRWLLSTYTHLIKDAVNLDDADIKHFEMLIRDNKEAIL